MPTVSKTSCAVLAVAAVGVVQILQAGRYQRRKLALHATEMHQAWLSEIASNEELRAAWWAPDKDASSSRNYALLVQANRQVCLLSAKFRAGLLDRRTLRVQAKWLMERELGRTYWREFGAFRESEAKDRVDRVFNQILADEYLAFSDADTVAP
ncbi:DUF6082 family protein [Streptomyces solaniscabiei]|uniref:DUF6082 family protein n=1 Tax=Streptomyces solaniscabiei TaxID=2683255 RepID=UPI001CE2B0D3|nr:DUF6082 family protein [Streptomyces solaniscabiei]